VRVAFVPKDDRQFLGCYIGGADGGAPELSAAAVFDTGSSRTSRQSLFRRPGGNAGAYWDFRSVYTPTENRGQFYCAQRLLCAVLRLAEAAGAAGVQVSAQAETIRKDCFARGFHVTNEDELGAR
jgi:hypothetical protein